MPTLNRDRIILWGLTAIIVFQAYMYHRQTELVIYQQHVIRGLYQALFRVMRVIQ